MEVCKESIRNLLKESGFQNITIEVDEDLATHRAHKRNIEELELESEQRVPSLITEATPREVDFLGFCFIR